ncbi:MAG: 30S ribosomal protein S20 [Chlamydiales bacterium]|nr:30S ribosomal protein S20 [Chlamydiia bacterium]MCP5507509.1 30S ribosomal protein S20 [Chlamydiales bacterium]
MAKDSGEKKKTKRPTALKRDIQNSKKRAVNKSFKSEMRTAIRRFNESVGTTDPTTVKEKLNDAYSMLDKGVKRGIIKLNTASRTKSRMAARAAKA